MIAVAASGSDGSGQPAELALAAGGGLRTPDSGTIAALERWCPGGVRTSVPLATLSRWRIGGPADCVVAPSGGEECRLVLDHCRAHAIRTIVVGHGSNLLFDDAGLRGVVVHIGQRMARVEIEGTLVWSQAGAWVPSLARRIGAAGLTGAEHLVGIPGTLGGLVCMNGGSLRRSVGEHVEEVTCVMPDGRLETFPREACGFAYRRSRFQTGGVLVVECRLRFPRGDSGQSRRRMLEIMASRRRRFPLRLPNCGSVFVSDPAMYETVGPPGAAIERCGLKGLRMGGAEISPLHGNFIVNLGGASSRDVLGLVHTIRNRVREETGFWMDCEVRHVDPDGVMRPAHEVEWQAT